MLESLFISRFLCINFMTLVVKIAKVYREHSILAQVSASSGLPCGWRTMLRCYRDGVLAINYSRLTWSKAKSGFDSLWRILASDMFSEVLCNSDRGKQIHM